MSMTPAQRRRQDERASDGRYTSRIHAESGVTLSPVMGHNRSAEVYSDRVDQAFLEELADHGSSLNDRLAVSSSAHEGVTHLCASDPDPAVRLGALAKGDLSDEDRARLESDEEVARLLARVAA